MTPIALKNQSQTAMGSLMSESKAQGASKANADSARPLDLSRYAPKVATGTKQEQVEKQVRNWVGESFYGTLLKQMRDSPFKTEMFDGGKAGDSYNQLFDQRLAQHMASSVGSKIVRPMVKKILNQKAADQYKQQSNKASSKETSDVSTDRRA